MRLLHCHLLSTARLIAAAASLLSPVFASAQMLINGHKPFVDKSQGGLLFVAPVARMTNYAATVEKTSDEWTELTVEGKEISTATTIDFGDVSRGRSFSLCGKYKGKDSTMTVSFTSLPVIELRKPSAFSNDYEPCQIIIDEPDSPRVAPVYSATVKHRGGSTNADDRHKRNYHFKLLDNKGASLDLPLLGLRDDNSWLLDAGQVDLFRVRNHICHELWLDFSTPPYYHQQEPKSINGCNAKMIELFVNDEYRGIYSLLEPVDRKQLKLKKYKKGVKGCLWKTKDWQGTTFYDVISSYNNQSATLMGFEAKYPEPGDDADTTDYSPLAAAVNFVVSSTDTDFKQHIGEYIDVPVLMDYSLFVDLINGIDNGGKNCYWSVYDKSKGGRMSLTPWDMDATFGQNYTNNPVTDDLTQPDNNIGSFTNIEARLIAVLGTAYDQAKQQRYAELRKTFFDEKQLDTRFEVHYDTLAYSGAVKRETEKWSGDTDLGGKALDFEGELTAIKNWIQQRLSFLDNKYGYVSSGITRIGFVPYDDAWYTLYGLRVAHPTKGVYIHKGKKIVVSSFH